MVLAIRRVSKVLRDASDRGIHELRTPFQADDLGLQVPFVSVKTNVRDRSPIQKRLHLFWPAESPDQNICRCAITVYDCATHQITNRRAVPLVFNKLGYGL